MPLCCSGLPLSSSDHINPDGSKPSTVVSIPPFLANEIREDLLEWWDSRTHFSALWKGHRKRWFPFLLPSWRGACCSYSFLGRERGGENWNAEDGWGERWELSTCVVSSVNLWMNKVQNYPTLEIPVMQVEFLPPLDHFELYLLLLVPDKNPLTVQNSFGSRENKWRVWE